MNYKNKKQPLLPGMLVKAFIGQKPNENSIRGIFVGASYAFTNSFKITSQHGVGLWAYGENIYPVVYKDHEL